MAPVLLGELPGMLRLKRIFKTISARREDRRGLAELDRVGLEARTLEVRGREQRVDAWVETSARPASVA